MMGIGYNIILLYVVVVYCHVCKQWHNQRGGGQSGQLVWYMVAQSIGNHSSFIIMKRLHEILMGSPPAGVINTGGV